MSQVDELLDPDDPVDLSNCDREPIHIPGAIQPHGMLLAVTEEGVVVQISDTVVAELQRPVEQIVGCHLGEILDTGAAAKVRDLLREPGTGAPVVALADRVWELSAHRSDGLLIYELEPHDGAPEGSADARAELNALEAVPEIARHAAADVRRLSGYDRVMVYRFDGDGHGEVIAEAADGRLDSFLGHHYPASDIPRQARALYLRQTVRMIVDVDYVPSPISPSENPLTGQPLDLGLARLRSVSPVHLEYLRNMGVTATLVVSIVNGGELWGLIACHHYAPHYASSRVRDACMAIGDQLAAAIVERERRETRRQRVDLEVLVRQLLRLVRHAPTAQEGLEAGENLLLRIAEADGATLIVGDVRQTFGVTPTAEDEREILALMPGDGTPLVVDRLTRELPFVSHNTDMCGVLAVPCGERPGDLLVFYRDEWVHDLTWGGDPRATLRPDLTSTSLKNLSPRRSFEAWRQAVIGRSQPWRPAQIGAARQLADDLAAAL